MRFPDPLIPGTLLRRYKRFIADVRLADGREVAVHCTNTGAMLGCSDPGSPVYISRSPNPNRKLAYTLELVQAGGTWIGVNTMRPNQVVAEAIAAGQVPELAGYPTLRREVKFGPKHRLDICLEGPQGTCYVEVKNVTLGEGDTALFPDAVSERATNHLLALRDAVREGHRGVIFFLVQRDDCRRFMAARHIDPVYADTLARVVPEGVEALVYRSVVGPEELAIGARLQAQIEAGRPEDRPAGDIPVREMGLGASGLVDARKAPKMGALYGIQAFVKGTVDRQGDQYRCVFQIIDTTTGLLTPGEAMASDPDALSDRIAEEVLRLLGMPAADLRKVALQAPGLKEFGAAFDSEQRGDLTAAARGYQAALKTDPKFPEAWNNLAGIYRKQGQVEEALQAYQQGLAVAPNQALLHANLGNLYFDQNRIDDATREYQKAQQLDDGMPRVHYNMACIHALQGRLQLALSSLERALQLLPELKRAAQQDADLKALRAEPRFRQLVGD